MEKRRPTYDLDSIKAAIGTADTLAMTRSATRDAAALGFTRRDVAETIRRMTRNMFFKSMTTYGDGRTWQDVYHVRVDDIVLYVKFQADLITEFTVVSFKEK